MSTVVAVGVGFSVLLMSVAFGVAHAIKHRLSSHALNAVHGLDVGRIDTILTLLTVVVTSAVLAQTCIATYTQGVAAMATRQEEIAIRRQSGVLRARLMLEFTRAAGVACLVGGILGDLFGVLAGLGLRAWTVLPVQFNALALLGAFPTAVIIALAATSIPAWRSANVSPTLLRRA